MGQKNQEALPVIDQGKREVEKAALRNRMEKIGEKLLVLSGKGGVGKSTVAANLAVALAQAGQQVGLLDVDVHGPSVPKLMGLEGKQVLDDGECLLPVSSVSGVKVMSIGFLLPTQNDAVIWRGPRKYGIIRQFLMQVKWGDLDYLVIDAPPGTGDEPMAVAEMAQPRARAVLVTTPQELAVADVRRSVSFCREVELPLVGIVENMSGFVCPHCEREIALFGSGGGEKLAKSMKVPFLGKIPFDQAIVTSGDAGESFTESAVTHLSAGKFGEILDRVLASSDRAGAAKHDNPRYLRK